MRPARPVPSALRGGPFDRRSAVEHLPLATLYGPSYRAVTRGVHVAATAPTDHGTRVLAARVAHGADAVVCGRSAAWVWGVEQARRDEPAELVLPRHVRRRAEIVARRDVLRPDEVVVVPGWGRVTTPARTGYDVGRCKDLATAVRHLDALVARTGTTPQQIVSCVVGRPGARWITTLRQALDLCDPGAESPRESDLRVLLVTAGLPRPVTQHVALDSGGRFVARVDLAWPRRRLAVEYDGAHHDDPDQVRKDRARLNALRLAGWTVIVVDRHQMRAPDAVVAMVAAALRGPA